MSTLNKLETTLKNRLSEGQKEAIKKVLPFIGVQNSKVRQVRAVKHRLNNLGFTERGLEDLEGLYYTTNNMKLRKYIALELALWHTNQYTQEDAVKALDYLKEFTEGNGNDIEIRQATVLTSECLVRLGYLTNARRLTGIAALETPHPDIFLAAAATETELEDRLSWINLTLDKYKLLTLKLKNFDPDKTEPYDALETAARKTLVENDRLLNNKVTVIMPVYNAEKELAASLGSILKQTWTNLEVIVVDDASTDKTAKKVERYSRKDERVTFIRADRNAGPYVARNLALQQATGDFITINDGDDWSHPEKIEKQVLDLIQNPHIVGNMSEQARMTNDLTFYRRGKPGDYIIANFSSFMFRRKKVLEKLGHWDSVRFAADSEFYLRVKLVFGEKAVKELKTGPLSFQRQTSGSLTGNEIFGYPGYKMGARREYEMGHNHFHKLTNNFYYPFPQTARPFTVPAPMHPVKEQTDGGFRKFDLLIAADFRDKSALSEKDLEILQNESLTSKYKIGFVQLHAYDRPPHKDIHTVYRSLINNGTGELVVYGEKIEAEATIISGAQCLNEYQKYVPQVKSKETAGLIKKTPGSSARILPENIQEAEERTKHYFGAVPDWYLLDAVIRKQVEGKKDSSHNQLSIQTENWPTLAGFFERIDEGKLTKSVQV